MHLVIALIIDPFWIKARKEGSYLQQSRKWRLSLRVKKQNPSVVKPARLWSPAPAAAIQLLSSGWAEARTSSTDKANLYLLTSLSSHGPARGPTAAVSDRRTVRSPSP